MYSHIIVDLDINSSSPFIPCSYIQTVLNCTDNCHFQEHNTIAGLPNSFNSQINCKWNVCTLIYFKLQWHIQINLLCFLTRDISKTCWKIAAFSQMNGKIWVYFKLSQFFETMSKYEVKKEWQLLCITYDVRVHVVELVSQN